MENPEEPIFGLGLRDRPSARPPVPAGRSSTQRLTAGRTVAQDGGTASPTTATVTSRSSGRSRTSLWSGLPLGGTLSSFGGSHRPDDGWVTTLTSRPESVVLPGAWRSGQTAPDACDDAGEPRR